MASSGLVRALMASRPRAPIRRYSSSSAMLRRRSLNCEMSAPATKALSPAPRMMTTRMASSVARSWTYFGMSSQVSTPTAFRFSGRLKMIQPMGPSFSIKRLGVSLMVDHLEWRDGCRATLSVTGPPYATVTKPWPSPICPSTSRRIAWSGTRSAPSTRRGDGAPGPRPSPRGGSGTCPKRRCGRCPTSRARTLQQEHGLDFLLLHGNAERVPLPDASFDLALSEYGASLWCDPYRLVPEAARLLRPGGHLIFLKNGTLLTLCLPDDDSAATERLRRDSFGLHRLEWADTGTVEFALPVGDWVRLLRANGFELLDLMELRAPQGASTRYTFVTSEWAHRWPSEEIWRLRKRAP